MRAIAIEPKWGFGAHCNWCRAVHLSANRLARDGLSMDNTVVSEAFNDFRQHFDGSITTPYEQIIGANPQCERHTCLYRAVNSDGYLSAVGELNPNAAVGRSNAGRVEKVHIRVPDEPCNETVLRLVKARPRGTAP